MKDSDHTMKLIFKANKRKSKVISSDDVANLG
jgi:hypothetical protein